MQQAPALFISSSELEQYHYPPDCPFSADRTRMTRETARTLGLLPSGGKHEHAPVAATRAELERFHTPKYLDTLREASQGRMTAEGLHMGLGQDDSPVFRDLYDYAVLACGATLTAARLVLAGVNDRVFTPSGGYHHAHPEYAHGFCYINDIVIACDELARAGRRVLFLDIDVHHCDGVQDAFYARDDILVISTHESPKTLFPHTGEVDEIGRGRGEGFNVNVPLPKGTHDAAFFRAYREVAAPLIDKFAPDVIVVEAGMDCLASDPLANLRCTNNVYADILHDVLRFGLPTIVTGGGGYHIENSVRGWALLWSVLAGEDDPHDIGIGMGGVMLESTDWRGGLRDHEQVLDADTVDAVNKDINATIAQVKERIWPRHGM